MQFLVVAGAIFKKKEACVKNKGNSRKHGLLKQRRISVNGQIWYFKPNLYLCDKGQKDFTS